MSIPIAQTVLKAPTFFSVSTHCRAKNLMQGSQWQDVSGPSVSIADPGLAQGLGILGLEGRGR